MIFINIHLIKILIIYFGNTKTKDFLTKNYINVPIKKNKSRFASTTNEYCDNFIKISKKYDFEVIEIHNRPLVFNYLKQRLKKNLFYIFIIILWK